MRLILLILLSTTSLLISQTLSPKVTDNGGGRVSGTSYALDTSIGQAVIGFGHPAHGTSFEAGYVTSYFNFTAIHENNPKTPKNVRISDFAPNPFNSSTRITVYIPAKSEVTLQIFDLKGCLILDWRKKLRAGSNTIIFTPSKSLPSGTYLYRIAVESVEKFGKIAFVK